MSAEVGPFWCVQLTYKALRVARTEQDDGSETLAYFHEGEGLWVRESDGVRYSDIVIYCP